MNNLTEQNLSFFFYMNTNKYKHRVFSPDYEALKLKKQKDGYINIKRDSCTSSSLSRQVYLYNKFSLQRNISRVFSRVENSLRNNLLCALKMHIICIYVHIYTRFRATKEKCWRLAALIEIM